MCTPIVIRARPARASAMLSRLAVLKEFDKDGRFLAPSTDDTPLSFWRPRSTKVLPSSAPTRSN